MEDLLKKNSLIYHEYLGDSDTPSFRTAVVCKPYEEYNIIPTKLECVDQVHKRVGIHLRNKVKKYKDTSTSIGEKAMVCMQNFYGMAIPQNLNDKYEMKISLTLFHCTDIADAE